MKKIQFIVLDVMVKFIMFFMVIKYCPTDESKAIFVTVVSVIMNIFGYAVFQLFFPGE